jgi:hypothetical protein
MVKSTFVRFVALPVGVILLIWGWPAGLQVRLEVPVEAVGAALTGAMAAGSRRIWRRPPRA